MKLLLITCWKRPFTAFGERMNYNWVIALIHSDPLRQSLPYPAWSKFKRTKEDRAASYTLVIAEGLGKCFCTGAMGSASRQAFHLCKTLSFSYTWTKYTLTLLWSKHATCIDFVPLASRTDENWPGSQFDIEWKGMYNSPGGAHI